MPNDGTVKIGLSLDTTQADEQAKQVGNKYGKQITDAINQQAKSASSSAKQAIGDIGSQMESYGKSYSKAVTLPILAAGGASIAAAVNIDTALTGVRKTVDGTAEQYEELKQKAIEFSKTNAVDPAQILDIQALGAQLGYSIDELQMFGEVVSGLDIATNMNADEAATELAQFANIMGMAHDETKNYGSTIVELGNNFATTEADISHMAMRIAAAGKQIGMSEADVLGMATALSSMGIEAEAGGTAISTIMSSIDKTVSKASENMKMSADEMSSLSKKEQNEILKMNESLLTWAETANMSAEEFMNAWKNDPTEALSAVLVGMDKATEAGGNMAVMLDELGITSIRQTDTLKRLASNSEFLGNAVRTANDAWAENTALDKEVENRNNSMAAQLEILKNKVTAVAVEVGEPLARSLLAIIDAAQPLIDALASGAKSFADLDDNGKKLVMTAVGVVAAFGPVTTIAGKVLKSTASMGDGWKRMSANLKAVKAGLTESTTATMKQAAAQVQYKTIMAGGMPTVVKYNAATKEMTVVSKANTAATKAQTTAVSAFTKVSKVGAVAVNGIKTAFNGLKAAFASFAPMLVITAAVEAITYFSNKLSEASERADRLSKASDGMADSIKSYDTALRDTRASFDKSADGAEDYASSISDVISAADSVIDKHLELADSISATWSDTGTNQALVEQYVGTIKSLTTMYDELGNARKNDAAQQAELIAAVDGLNSIMGTSYSVIDAENGILNENVGAIEAVTAAWAEQAKVRAAQETLVDLEKERINVNNQLKDTQKALEEETQRNIDAWGKLGDVQVWTSQEQIDLENRVEELTASLEGTDSAITNTKDLLAEYSETAATTTDSLTSLIQQNEAFSSKLDSMGISVDDFVKGIYSIGVSVEDLSAIMANEGEAGIDGFVAAYQGGTQSLIDWMGEHGYEIPRELADSINEGKPEAEAAAEDVADSVQSELEDINGGDIGKKEIGEYANAIGQGSNKNEQAAEKNAKVVAAKLRDADSGTWGNHLVNNFAAGMGGAIDAVKRAAGNVMNAIANIIKFTVPKSGIFSGAEKGGELSGRHLVENFAAGMESADSVMVAAAEKGLKAVRNTFGEAGISMADEFASSFESADPMGQIQSSIAKGVSVQTFAAGAIPDAPSNTTNNMTSNQTIVFEGDVQSPDIIARKMRLEQRYGMAGEYSR